MDIPMPRAPSPCSQSLLQPLTWLICLATFGDLFPGALLFPVSARAATGGVNILPQAGRVNTSGVRLVIDTRWIDGTGYHPVRVEIVPLKAPAAVDRQFRVVLKPNNYFGNSSDSISQIVELAQGSNRAVAIVPVPQEAP